MVPGPLCVLHASRRLRVWVGAPPDAEIEILVDGRRIDAAPKPVRKGQRFSLILPAAAKRLHVLVSSPGGQASWSLAFAQEARGSNLLREVGRKLVPVHFEIMEGRLATARKSLQAIQLPSKAPAESRYEVTYYRALLAEREGDYRSAMAEAQAAEEIAERGKLERYRWMAEQRKGLILTAVGRFRDAVLLFSRLRREPLALTPCEEATVPANQAWAMLLAREAGERLADPTPHLETALATFETCKTVTPGQRMNILIDLALAHLQEGRLAQAKDVLARARGLDPDPRFLNLLWHLDLEARISLREGRPAEALRLFGRIEEIASAAGSPDYRLRAAFGKAQSQRDLGGVDAALEILREAEALLDEQSLQIPLQEGRETFMGTRHAVVNLHVELLLDQGRNEEALVLARHALSRLLRQLERSQSLASLPPERKARWERLVADYHEKRAALEERAKDEWRLPADQAFRARAVTAAEAEEVKKILDEAFQVLPQERPREESPEPRPGELILAYHPLSRGWAGFAADGSGPVRVHRFELPQDLTRLDELAARLLMPFRDSIESAERIRILAGGSLQDIDFHALPFGGDILLAKAPMAYGLDLPVPLEKVLTRHALLVADTRDNLQGALDESRKVIEILRSGPRPWTTEELEGEEASVKAVRKQLTSADLLHYAGHGSFSESGGWDSSLLLAGDTRLTPGDLLTLDRVPAWVVLSACETGRSSTKVPIESVGLAQAFVVAGSRAVIASIRPVKDSDLPAFFSELYREWEREQDLAVALQHAQLSWRKRHPLADWQSFRLFEP